MGLLSDYEIIPSLSKTAGLCQECVREEDAMKMFDNVKAAINYMTTV